MPRRTHNTDENTEVSPVDDTEDTRTFEHPDAEAVRSGKLSAAQMTGGHGNVDPEKPDAQYPPGVVDNAPPNVRTTDEKPLTTDANPDYA